MELLIRVEGGTLTQVNVQRPAAVGKRARHMLAHEAVEASWWWVRTLGMAGTATGWRVAGRPVGTAGGWQVCWRSNGRTAFILLTPFGELCSARLCGALQR